VHYLSLSLLLFSVLFVVCVDYVVVVATSIDTSSFVAIVVVASDIIVVVADADCSFYNDSFIL
jgi:hypothetical protein